MKLQQLLKSPQVRYHRHQLPPSPPQTSPTTSIKYLNAKSPELYLAFMEVSPAIKAHFTKHHPPGCYFLFDRTTINGQQKCDALKQEFVFSLKVDVVGPSGESRKWNCDVQVEKSSGQECRLVSLECHDLKYDDHWGVMPFAAATQDSTKAKQNPFKSIRTRFGWFTNISCYNNLM